MKNPNQLRGELYIDESGEAHFVCHTPATVGFIEAREGLTKFVELLQDKIDNQQQCPHFTGG